MEIGIPYNSRFTSMPHSGFRIRPVLPVARGPLWITAGVAWVALAQIGESLPMATAVAVIGSGAMELVRRRRCRVPDRYGPSGGIALLVNLLVYVALAGLTIAAQWDLALRSPAGRLDPLTAMDHALAMGLLLHLTWRTANCLTMDSS